MYQCQVYVQLNTHAQPKPKSTQDRQADRRRHTTQSHKQTDSKARPQLVSTVLKGLGRRRHKVLLDRRRLSPPLKSKTLLLVVVSCPSFGKNGDVSAQKATLQIARRWGGSLNTWTVHLFLARTALQDNMRIRDISKSALQLMVRTHVTPNEEECVSSNV